jgi:hypothetical protein
MMMSIWVSEADIVRMTGYKQPGAQAKVLESRGIPYRLEGKTVLVLCVDAEKWVRGEPMVSNGGINWGAVT